MHQSEEELITLLHKNGLKVTPQRLAIYRYLENNKSHPSADTIFQEVKKELPTISHGTVYNTLSILTDIGMIRELNMENGQSRYDTNTDVHINLICPICDHITDYQSEKVIGFWEEITDNIGGEITGHRFDIQKVCKDCSTQ